MPFLDRLHRSRTRARTSPRSRRRPRETATSGSSTVRRSGRASPTTRTTFGWPRGPIRTRKPHRINRSASSSCRRTPRASAARRFTRWARTTSTRPTTENVRIPAENLVDREGAGWKLITSQLNHERVALCSVGPLERILKETIEWAKEQPDGRGGVLLDRPFVRPQLGPRQRENCRRCSSSTGARPSISPPTSSAPAEASAIKVYGSELYVEGSRLLMEVHGAAGLPAPLERGAPCSAGDSRSSIG